MSEPFVIGDHNWHLFAAPQMVQGVEMGRGLIPRNFLLQPFASIDGLPARALPEFTDEEIADKLADQERHKSSLFHMRADYKIRSLNQANYPYCWAFSTTKSIMYARARMNEPMEELSGWMLGSVASGFVKRGGWTEESLRTAREVGINSLAEWPQGGTSRSLWTETMKAAAAKRKVIEWSDIPNDDRNTRILASLLLSNTPVQVEYNWMGHSMNAFYLRSWKPLRYDVDNSWTPQWGNDGTATFEGAKAIPDNMACVYFVD